MIGRNYWAGFFAATTLALLGGCDFLGAKQAAFDSPDLAGEALIAAARWV